MQSLRNQDMRAEQKLAEFMDEYFYSKLKSKTDGPLSYSRVLDRNVQLNGVDIFIEVENRKMLIDTKYCLVNGETVEMPVNKRRFMMGNALVVNVIKQMEKELSNIFDKE